MLGTSTKNKEELTGRSALRSVHLAAMPEKRTTVRVHVARETSLTHLGADLRRTQAKVRGGRWLSYLHSRIVLGLGKRGRIDCLEVKWPLPGGETQRFKDSYRPLHCDCRR